MAISALGLTGCDSRKWDFARGTHQLEQGNPEGLELMKSAIDKDTPEIELALPLAMELSTKNDHSALTLIDQVLKQESGKETVRKILDAKWQCQSNLLQFRESLETFKSLLEDRTERNDGDNNTLAYLRALANTELDLAYENISDAIAKRSAATDWCCGQRLDLCQKTVVASALLSRYFFYETAKDPGIESIDAAHLRLRKSLAALSEEVLRVESDLLTVPAVSTDENVERKRYILRSNLAVLLLARAFVRQDLGMQDECNRDHALSRSLSKDFDKLVSYLPSELECMENLDHFSAYLDTMGFVQTRLPWPDEVTPFANMTSSLVAMQPASSRAGYEDAIRNFNVAIEARRTFLRGLKGELTNTLKWPYSDNRKIEKGVRRSEAVFLYHRMLAHKRKKNLEAANEDQQAIIKLGFEPDDHLN